MPVPIMHHKSGQPKKPDSASPPAYITAAMKMEMLAKMVSSAKDCRTPGPNRLARYCGTVVTRALIRKGTNRKTMRTRPARCCHWASAGRHALDVADADQPDKMLGRDIGGDIGAADHVPGQRATG